MRVFCIKAVGLIDTHLGYQVTVKSLSPTFMRVALSDKLTGIVPPIHYSDIVLKHPERKFEEGKSVKARVSFTCACDMMTSA